MSVPPILPADGVTVLWMLREGDVDANQRRAVLQRHAASNHSYPTGKTKGSREGCTMKREDMNGLQ